MGREADSERSPRCGASPHAPTRTKTLQSTSKRGEKPLFSPRTPLFTPPFCVVRTRSTHMHVEIAIFHRKSRVWSGFALDSAAQRVDSTIRPSEAPHRRRNRPIRPGLAVGAATRRSNRGAAGEKSPSRLYSGGEAMALADRGPRPRRQLAASAGPASRRVSDRESDALLSDIAGVDGRGPRSLCQLRRSSWHRTPVGTTQIAQVP